jgi:hypothetical protein
MFIAKKDDGSDMRPRMGSNDSGTMIFINVQSLWD